MGRACTDGAAAELHRWRRRPRLIRRSLICTVAVLGICSVVCRACRGSTGPRDYDGPSTASPHPAFAHPDMGLTSKRGPSLRAAALSRSGGFVATSRLGSPVGVRSSTGIAPQRSQRTAAGASSEGEDSALTTSGFVGVLGSVVVSLAVLPYLPLSLYSSYLLLTTGAGVPAGPNGIYGLAEGFATLTIIGVSLWSAASLFQRDQGLPQGPLNLLNVTKGLSVFCLAAFFFATTLNITLEPAENPFRGLSLGSDEKQIQVAASKAGKAAEKVTTKVIDATAGTRTGLEGALKDISKSTSSTLEEASKSASSVASDTLAKVSSQSSDAVSRLQNKMKELQAPTAKSAPSSSAPAPATTKVEEPAKTKVEEPAKVDD